jgi:hypothetical protein
MPHCDKAKSSHKRHATEKHLRLWLPSFVISGELEFSFSLLALWPYYCERTLGRAGVAQEIRVLPIDVRDGVTIQFFAHKPRECFAIRQFIVGDFTNCLGDATAREDHSSDEEDG